jgi:hypothetical protein
MHLTCTYAYHGNISGAQCADPPSPGESTEPEPHSLVSPRSSVSENRERDEILASVPVMIQQLSPAATSTHEGTMNLDDSQHSDVANIMPWLSWDWSEQMPVYPANMEVPLLSIPAGTSDQLLSISGSWSIGNDQVTPEGLVDDCYASLQVVATNIVDSKLDPVEHHRNRIIEHLHSQPHIARRHRICWLERDNFQVLLKTYFDRHHRHTPIIHISTFNVVSCPTSLIFAMALVAASYMPRLGLRAEDTLALAGTAYSLALQSDEVRYYRCTA